MATVNGLKALGWSSLSGALEPNKRADLILFDKRSLSQPYLAAHQDPIDTLIYRGKASSVDTVMVEGEILYRGKQHLRLKPKKILADLVCSVTLALTDRAPSLETELYPCVLRYYQAWDDETIILHHKVNSIN
jgi:5-methylthioadenosine/S-adenosylhomocysteine deaminase